jgi:hypothetical protein
MMELFYSGGGNPNPNFLYKVKIKRMTTEAFDWCSNYPSEGYFQRWYVQWGPNRGLDYDIVQFEWEEPALMFALKFGHI